MTTVLGLCLILVLVGMPVYFLYWHAFRPVALRTLRYELFRARDQLRLMVIDGEITEKEKAYPILERRCNVCIKLLENTILTAWRRVLNSI